MHTTAFVLAVLALALAWPIPVLVSSARWPSSLPGTALVLWQAIALAGGLSMIGALLCYGLASFGDDLVAGITELAASIVRGSLPPGATFAEMFALSGALLLGVHLLLNLLLALVRDRRSLRRHRDLIAMLSSPMPEHPRARVLQSREPLAYSLPGSNTSVTVLSAGLVDILDEAELSAVIAHERAHLEHHHHLVLVAFRAWRRSLPWFPIASGAASAVERLVEMVADDAARAAAGAAPLRSALTKVTACGATLSGEVAVGDTAGTEGRIDRLREAATADAHWIPALVYTVSFLLLAAPTALIFAPVATRA